MSELMRQAAQGFTPANDEADINALLERVDISTRGSERSARRCIIIRR
ncbi:hypothetical protein ACU4GD_16245 [Cupriavidus basilensis]